MGHAVSTHRGGAAAALALLLAASSSSASSAASRRRGCFAPPPLRPSRSAAERAIPSSAAAAALARATARRRPIPSARGSVASASASSSSSTASVPPPNSRLGRRRRRRAESLLTHPPGTKRSEGRGRRDSRLGYAAHGSCCAGGLPWKGFAPSAAEAERGAGVECGSDALAPVGEGPEREEEMREHERRDGRVEAGGGASVSGRRRARMLRFLDRRFSRLRLKSSRGSSVPSKKKKKSLFVRKERHNDYNGADDGGGDDEDRRLAYERRKAAWAAKYTSVSTLRQSFGKNKNRLWGDFDPAATRRLYHALLPRALLELRGLRDGLLSDRRGDGVDGMEDGAGYESAGSRKDGALTMDRDSAIGGGAEGEGGDRIVVVDDDDDDLLQRELKELAPLAYRARVAAKKYARERSRLPGRIGSMLYDGYRSWRRYGKWTSAGMTWEQVWSKYEDQVLREATAAPGEPGRTSSSVLRGLDDDELTARICMRILERSVVTNEAIDRIFLKRLAEDEEEEDRAEAEEEAAGAGAGAVGGGGASSFPADDVETRRRRRRRRERRVRRRRQIVADLRAIERKFDDDVRELLRYSDLTTREGDDRRRRRRKGKRRGTGGGPTLFWKDRSGAEPSTDARGRAETAASSAEDRTGAEGGMSAPETLARGGEGANGAVDIPVDLAAAMFSVAGAVSSAADDGSGDDLGELERRRPSNAPSLRRLAMHEVFALRILATTKQRISSLQALPQLGGQESNEDVDE
ncbi:hypothetical protein ACHAWF_006248 [Thalassiosira exigua]